MCHGGTAQKSYTQHLLNRARTDFQTNPSELANPEMYHEPIKDRIAQPAPKDPPARRRRIIGFRELFLVLLAFALLAIVPSAAQIASNGGSRAQPLPVNWDAEYPAANFPGSAFFYLDSSDTPRSAALGQQLPGGGAQPFILRAGSIEYARALKCLTDAIYYEAANEPDDGQRAIAQVILNRMRHPAYPNSVCGVVYQGSERATGCQFSYSCDGSMARVPARRSWLRTQYVAADALAGYVHAPVGMATHYHANYVYPAWAPSLNVIATIGAHRFYSWKGKAGQPSAFAVAYAGREPYPGRKPRSWSRAPNTDLDPVTLHKKFEAEFAADLLAARSQVRSGVKPTIAPDAVFGDETRVYAHESADLPHATNIKPQYQNSGSWKNLPAR